MLGLSNLLNGEFYGQKIKGILKKNNINLWDITVSYIVEFLQKLHGIKDKKLMSKDYGEG